MAAAALPLPLLAFAPALTAQTGPSPYRVDWLGPYFYPTAINDHGQVVGSDVRVPGYGPALMWQDGTVTELGIGQGHDINNQGVAVLGVPVPGLGTPGPVILGRDGVRTDLGMRYGWGGDFRHEFSINDAGQVVGQERIDTTGSDGRAFIWEGGTVTYLDLGFPATLSSAHAISNAGHVVGWYSDGLYSNGGFLWKDGRVTLLGSPAVSVNDCGQVLMGGVWTDGDLTPIPALPLLPGSTDESAGAVLREINNLGHVVGWSQEMYLIDPESGHGTIERAFLWDPVNGTQDLSALTGLGPNEGRYYPLAQAVDINNAGQIVGFGTQGGWVLTPVPEPGGVLSVLGLVAVGRRAVGRRRVASR